MFVKSIENSANYWNSLYISIAVFVLGFLIALTIFLIFKKPQEKFTWDDVLPSLFLVGFMCSMLSFVITLGVLVFTNKETITYTNSISQAKSIDDEKFLKKISQISNVTNLKYKNNESEIMTVTDLENDDFVEIVGIKNGKKMNVLVYFEKDTMKVSVNEGPEKAQEFEYNPKVDKK